MPNAALGRNQNILSLKFHYAAGDNAMNSFHSLHEDNIIGQLATFDRMIFERV